MGVKCYTQKPVTVEAIEFDGTADCAAKILKWIGGSRYGRYESYDRVNGQHFPPTFLVSTVDGVKSAAVGDYIVKGSNGGLSTRTPEEFSLAYDEVDDETNCCNQARHTNGWHHDEDCKNWVLVY